MPAKPSWAGPAGRPYVYWGALVAAGVSTIITDLVCSGAFADRPSCRTLAQTPALLHLIDRGLVDPADDGGFRLTPKAMKQIITASSLASPHPITQPPAKALADMTTWELLLRVHADGWTWRQLTRAALPYMVGGPLIWYTSGFSSRSLHREYLLCMLTLPALTAASPEINRIPHGRTKDTYVKMLAGVAAPELLPLEDMEAEVVVPHVMYDIWHTTWNIRFT